MPEESRKEIEGFSLIYPDAETQARHYDEANRPDISQFVLDELGLTEVFSLKSSPLTEYFTVSPDVAKYRMDVFDDMLRFPSVAATLNKMIPILTDIIELRRLENETGNTESYLESITEIELYISSVKTLHEGFSPLRADLHSDALKRLADYVDKLVTSDYFRELNQKLGELTNRVREIRSITIGVNLDAQLRPQNAGVLSINSEPFRSGDVLEKILRLNFKEDEYTCIANLVPFNKKQNENQKTALSLAFNSAINEVYKSSLHSWKKIVQTYVLENTDFLLTLMPEIEFVTKGTEFLRALKAKNCTLTKPVFLPAKERTFRAIGLFNPCVALKIDDEVVPNDITFSPSDTLIYVLTGPNRGGKSVITCAIGLCQVMAQLGMFVPAESCELSPADAIFTHFPTGADDTIDKGRLGEECARLGEIFSAVTKYSLVLLDESLSSTGSFEASYIAAEILAGLSRVGCRTLFSTHLHELAADIEGINNRTAPKGGSHIDTLVAGIEEGKRSFRIVRARPDGKSYARDIADKYGLSYDSILKMIQK